MRVCCTEHAKQHCLRQRASGLFVNVGDEVPVMGINYRIMGGLCPSAAYPAGIVITDVGKVWPLDLGLYWAPVDTATDSMDSTMAPL